MIVFVVGVIPPPFGGVSIHVKRFAEYCWENHEQYTLAIFDYRKRQMFLKDKECGLFKAFFFWLKSSVVHIHMSGALKVVIAAASRFLRKKVVYTHHNSIVKNGLIFQLICKLCHSIILVNSETVLQKIKSEKDRAKVSQIPAFIPPVTTESLPVKLTDRLSKYRKVISTNCYSASLINGEEVYGISRIVRVFSEIAERGYLKDSVLLICDPSGSYESKIDWSAHEKLTGDNGIIYFGKPVNFSEVIKCSDVTIRATITDGDSISVRESLHFRTPIIASDCVVRPRGTLLYKTLDDIDLAKKMVVDHANVKWDYADQSNYADDIIRVYDRILAS